MAVAAAASAVSAGSLAVAAMPPQDDCRLIELEEKIFVEWNAAREFDPEIIRLAENTGGFAIRLAMNIPA
jgi:hypothetical protein